MPSCPTPRDQLIERIRELTTQVDALTEQNCRLSATNSILRGQIQHLESAALRPSSPAEHPAA